MIDADAYIDRFPLQFQYEARHGLLSGGQPNSKKTIYVLHPGPVYSREDGQLHLINPHELARLYKVDLKNCVIDGGRTALVRYADVNYVDLYPCNEGRYEVPNGK